MSVNHTAIKQEYKKVLKGFIEILRDRCAEKGIEVSWEQYRERERKEWEEFESRLRSCKDCVLCRGRTTVVIGSGPRESGLMVVGEAPGENEDRQGLPFVGRAGELLTKMLKAIEIDRDDVYITNVIKCRPPQNRAPFPDEISACVRYLDWQIRRVKPEVILAMGNYAVKTLTGTKQGITKIHGQVFEYLNIPVITTFHPAALLRNEEYKRPAWEDLKKLKRYLSHKGVKFGS